MPEVRIHRSELPSPITVLEEYLWEPRVSLIQATFANSYFVDPRTVRETLVYFPDRARTSKDHYPYLKIGQTGIWQENGRKVILDGNSKAQSAWSHYTGRPIARKSGYGVRHIWGNPWNPDAFTAGWNLCYMPYWAGMLTEDQHPHPKIQQAIKQASWFLYFKDNQVCDPPDFVREQDFDLDSILGEQPILVLRAKAKVRKSRKQGTILNADTIESIKNIRKQKHQSWKNIVKAALSLQSLDHEPFGSQAVANTAKACVRRLHRETGLTFEAIAAFASERG